MVSFREFAEFCSEIEKISSTLELASRIADFIQGIEDDEDLYNVVLFTMGKIYPPWDEREVGIGTGLIYEALRKSTGFKKEQIEDIVRRTGDMGLSSEEVLQSKEQTSLSGLIYTQEETTIKLLRESFDEMSGLTGKNSQKRKIQLLFKIYNISSPIEARYLTRLILGEMRLGVGEGIVRDAIAKAWGITAEIVERAYMITNDYGRVAVVAKNEGEKGLKEMNIELHTPVRMMLAQVAENMEEELHKMESAGVEWKFDGSRIQVHWGNGKVTIYSRRLEDVTRALPEIVREVKENVREGVVLDGEVVAIGKNGRPMSFQHILKRFRRKYDVEEMVEKVPLIAQFFDILYDDGKEVIDLPLEQRREILESSTQDTDIIKVAWQDVTSSYEEVQKVYNQALSAGHEGAMLKNLKSAYIPGKRGKHWLKLKASVESLDLVVIGGEWGEGKRSHLLSSYELACNDPVSGDLIPVGRVATGFNDEQLEEFTELFKPLIEYEEGKKAVFQPKIVFEVGYQEIQKSPKYDGGYALRFPRFIRMRNDKDVDGADTIERVAKLFEGSS
ncbi:MAG: ATP-dependent DNA ligase [Archaeoglobaceae archaeon]